MREILKGIFLLCAAFSLLVNLIGLIKNGFNNKNFSAASGWFCSILWCLMAD